MNEDLTICKVVAQHNNDIYTRDQEIYNLNYIIKDKSLTIKRLQAKIDELTYNDKMYLKLEDMETEIDRLIRG